MKMALKCFLIGIVIVIIFIFGINFYVKQSTKNRIIKNQEYKDLSDVDCIIILGAGVWGDSKIIMSGDHGREDYDEVNLMKNYAIEKGIPSEDIFMDHAGFSTYETMYRAKEIFKAKKVVIVTQNYHMYRALYDAKKLGLDAYGVCSDPRQYVGATYREIREILARDKDFVKCIFKPKPTYLGDEVPVSGNGDITNDKKRDV